MCFSVDEELFFRLTMLVLLSAFGGIRAYYERKVKKIDPELRKKRFRLSGSKYERKRDTVLQDMLAIGWAIPMLLYIAYPPWRAWSAIPLPTPIWVIVIGVILAVLSLVLLVWTHRTLGVFWTFKLEIRPKHKLVTWGPYYRIRHPMYTASLIFMFATGMIAADWLILVVSALTLLIINKRIDGEEKMMLDHFGKEYRDYMQRSRRLLPRLRRK
ncbi:MAG: isoprenylcysteine carboxylmethyltransferase family protein [Candidatus Atabeyarchaeum deiterrae]